MKEKTKTDKQDELPDINDCRAKQTDSLDYELVEPLIKHPKFGFALRFGFGYFCQHPRREEIVERTKALPKD